MFAQPTIIHFALAAIHQALAKHCAAHSLTQGMHWATLAGQICPVVCFQEQQGVQPRHITMGGVHPTHLTGVSMKRGLAL